MKRLLLLTASTFAMSSAVHAADLAPVTTYVEPGVVYAGVPSWTGVYAGLQAGYSWANNDFDVEDDFDFENSFGIDADGWLGGINIGADYQMGAFVIGIMADYNWSDIEGSESVVNLFGPGDLDDFNLNQDSVWNVLARAGWLANPNTLLYVLGGYSQASVDWEYDGDNGSADGDTELQGWTLGVGAEWMMTQNVSFKTEYRYTNWDGVDFEGDIEGGGGADQHTVLVGVNFRWGMFQ